MSWQPRRISVHSREESPSTAAKNLRPQPKVIVTSAYSREQAADYLQTDLESFIRKPFRAMQLTDLLTESVGRAPNRPN